ncbi:hypothetical protein [Helicobacter bilis]|uniref:Uncharacterized protein n=1 Tax=Helicobacter bilis TaxID=37372 RepID=A0A4U8UA82_9HELI|nr:hypothetical protein [Helicobacter bilis]TLE11816.1 hypothetical protein LS79_001535 [Helicobacter bilis]
MGLRESKRIRFIKENGIATFLWHTTCNSCVVGYLLLIYPKLALNKSQYKTFKLAYKHFEENYRNIIVISPLFFMKNLKKHIEWLESEIFKSQYGSIENLENLSKSTIGATMMSPQKDSGIDEFTPPPPFVLTGIHRKLAII